MENNQSPIHFKNLPLAAASEAIIGAGEPAFRARQVIKWVYQKRVDSFAGMKNVAKTTQEKLSRLFSLEKLHAETVLRSAHGDAVKFGFALPGSSWVVESVLLIDGDRRTACLSSQIGCGLGCTFCATGRLGFIRNLTQEEILGQLIGINDYCAAQGDKLVTNIVFMGMGEALSNFDNFRSSLDIIMEIDCFALGGRRITVSTAGVIPSIERLMAEDLNIGLAISLNEYSDARRSAIMPINRKYPMASLVEIARRYFEKTGRRVTFEYVVVPGETDTQEAAQALKKLLGGLTCKINIIPINPVGSDPASMPSHRQMVDFAERLHALDLAATLRTSRGRDIDGACGQLAGKRRAARKEDEEGMPGRKTGKEDGEGRRGRKTGKEDAED